MKINLRLITILSSVAIVILTGIAVLNLNSISIVSTNGSALSNKKIGWGIKRNDNHEQPDLGSSNKALIEKYNGLAMGNSESKNVYLTFDAGYEAGYTEKILDVLKENNVQATFFLTAHYINTQPELVQRMIDEGHIVGNHTPNYLMSGV